MASGVWLNRAAWPAVAGLLGAASALAWWAMGPDGAASWGWYARPRPEADQVWRWWTAALVHVNAPHLQANLWAAAVVAAWGWAARVRAAQALAWLLAWPVAQALLVTDPGTLSRYVGLSATLHAGAAIGCWHLLRHAQGWQRAVGAAVSVALLLKVGLEAPPAVSELPEAAGHVVAGYAHGCGVLAGSVVAALVDGIMALHRRNRPATSPP